MTTLNLRESILEKLPQIPYVIDQVGEALAWAQEILDEGEFNQLLSVTDEITGYVASISDPNFFKTHLVIASILSNIPDAVQQERFQKFVTSSGATQTALKKLGITQQEIEDKGCFKSLLLHLVPLAKEDESLFAISLIGIKHNLLNIKTGMSKADVKTPITSTDYISVLGYALVMANLRMANLKLLDKTYQIYNDILVILNNDMNY